MSGGKGGDETTTAAFLDEGKRTVGVWLPLALSDVYAALVANLRVWCSDEGRAKLKVPKRSECLAMWMLPIMSRSVKAGEDEAEALALFESVKQLAEKQKSKAEKK